MTPFAHDHCALRYVVTSEDASLSNTNSSALVCKKGWPGDKQPAQPRHDRVVDKDDDLVTVDVQECRNYTPRGGGGTAVQTQGVLVQN